MAKHYPGPWTLGKRDHKGWQHVDAAECKHFSFSKVAVHIEDDTLPNKSMMANARLIVAAPDLLKTLQDYLPVIEYLERKPELWGEIAYPLGIATANGYRHAIAKATGETP